jgi:hypothetical protein
VAIGRTGRTRQLKRLRASEAGAAPARVEVMPDGKTN